MNGSNEEELTNQINDLKIEKNIRYKEKHKSKDSVIVENQICYVDESEDDEKSNINSESDSYEMDFENSIENVELMHMKIESLSEIKISKYKNPKSICLRKNLIVSIDEVRDFPKTIEDLDFYDNRIIHISSQLKHLVNLKNLDFLFNNIKNIRNLDTLTQLQNLYFVQNNIKVIKNLDTLINLKNLELGGNKIEEINDGLKNLISLEKLWIGKNKIKEIKNLSNLQNLKILSLQSNKIRKIENLESLFNLEELYLSHNKIEKIENLENLKKLKIIDLTSNKITNLSNLKHLVELTDFWFSNNLVSDFNEINEQLGSLPLLETVYFEGNPIQKNNFTTYRRKLKLHLGLSVTKIDATYVQ